MENLVETIWEKYSFAQRADERRRRLLDASRGCSMWSVKIEERRSQWMTNN